MLVLNIPMNESRHSDQYSPLDKRWLRIWELKRVKELDGEVVKTMMMSRCNKVVVKVMVLFLRKSLFSSLLTPTSILI